MNIFDQYGIKEVADVTLYSIHKKTDGSGDVYYMPAIYFDTLKVSTVEKTAENTWAQGGIGNSKLINWDYGKEINITLEDALCTPASLGLCWGGVLSADWKNAHVDINSDMCACQNPVNRIDRMEAAAYPKNTLNNSNESVVGNLLPLTPDDRELIEGNLGIPLRSEVTDGVKATGTGSVQGHNYRWRLVIESAVRSIAQVPDRFFDLNGRAYPIDWNSKVSVFNGRAATGSNFKDAIIYKVGGITPASGLNPHIIFDAYREKSEDNDDITMSLQEFLTKYGPNLTTAGTLINNDNNQASVLTNDELEVKSLTEAGFLAIVVDNNDDYHAFIAAKNTAVDSTADSSVTWCIPEEIVAVSQFKGLDMWLNFDSINAMNYFILTKYMQDIQSIIPAERTKPEKVDKEDSSEVNKETTEITNYDNKIAEYKQLAGKLWAYVNPRTMKPYDDDYWFHYKEPYYIKSLTIADENKKIKANKIVVTADEFPGMYMLVGETYIRDRDTGEDQRMQLKFPLCKVRSDQTITLEAEGEPTVFTLNLEVAKPKSGAMMEITAYEVAKKMVRDKQTGCYYAVDGSSEVLSE